jgi:hypothetical protein
VRQLQPLVGFLSPSETMEASRHPQGGLGEAVSGVGWADTCAKVTNVGAVVACLDYLDPHVDGDLRTTCAVVVCHWRTMHASCERIGLILAVAAALCTACRWVHEEGWGMGSGMWIGSLVMFG